jgi:LIVCS family branched-chain amino acid:cation transporter
MKKNWLIISTGFALFSMFFGSGNLVFPITVGQESAGHYFLASLGILLTGVVVPFLGAFGMLLHNGDLSSFFSSFGKRGIFIFSFLALALMGPFGVLARCLTVAHGALLHIFPSVSLPVASFALCGIIFFLVINKNKLVSVLGTVLTPFLLLAIGAIAYFGLSNGSFPEISLTDLGWGSFKNGFFQGYQTMDLLASFFFSQFIIKHLYSRLTLNPEGPSTIKIFSKAALVGAGILASVYVVLVLLGWVYSPMLLKVPPQEMLGLIALKALGPMAGPCLCAAVILACLTTAVVLASLFSDFLRTEVCKGKIGNASSLAVTLLIGFTVSTFNFSGIAAFICPILEIVYPALIVLTVVNIACKYFSIRASHWPFTLSVMAKLCLL